MVSHGGGSIPYSPSAPPVPDPHQPPVAFPYNPPSASTSSSSYPYTPVTHPLTSSSSFGSGHFPPPQGYGYYPYQQQQQQQEQRDYSAFPPGTHPDVIRNFQMVDRNKNGYIEETELQEALSRTYQKFGRRALRLLIFLFRDSTDSFSRIGPKEFAQIWSCLNQWRGIFERFDRDRSGRIDAGELRDALYSLGYALPPAVLQVLISKYEDGSGRRVELNFDSFVECGMIVKGLTEKFKQKDPRYTGSATLTYDTFMTMIIPFLVSD